MVTAVQFFCTPFDYEHPQHFLKSQWQKNHKSVKFVAYRWLLAICFVILVTVVVIDFKLKAKYFFVSIANLILLSSCVLTILGAILTSMFNREMITNLTGMSRALKFYWFLWTQCLVFSLLYSTFFWFCEYKGSFTATQVVEVIVHPTLLVIDLGVVKHPKRLYNFLYMTIIEIVLLVSTVIHQLAGVDDKNDENSVNHLIDFKIHPLTALGTTAVIISSSIGLHTLINLIHKARKTLHFYLRIKWALRSNYIRIP